MTQVLEKHESLLASGESFGSERSWLRSLRTEARERFRELGLPTRQDEEWRFTGLKPLSELTFQPAEAADSPIAAERYFPGLDAWRLVFVNGVFAAEYSDLAGLPQGVRVTNLAAALLSEGDFVSSRLGTLSDSRTRAFSALNTANFRDGVFIHVPRGVTLDRPIHALHISAPGAEPAADFSRTLVVVEESASLKFIETHHGPQGTVYFSCPVSEFFVGDNASIDHYKVQTESLGAFHIAEQDLAQGRDSRFRSHSFTFGGQITRNNIYGHLRGAGIDCILNGLYVLHGKQHCDTFMQMEHAAPNCDSHELYKGVLDDDSTAVFRGRIHVHQIAQKTDAKQTNQNLLLTDRAQVVSKPQLEIYADDVKCTHGATTGQLDRNALFYLRARGVPEKEAMSLLIHAFASDVTERIHIDAVKDKVEELLTARLPFTA